MFQLQVIFNFTVTHTGSFTELPHGRAVNKRESPLCIMVQEKQLLALVKGAISLTHDASINITTHQHSNNENYQNYR
jgi:hypothetical protein